MGERTDKRVAKRHADRLAGPERVNERGAGTKRAAKSAEAEPLALPAIAPARRSSQATDASAPRAARPMRSLFDHACS